MIDWIAVMLLRAQVEQYTPSVQPRSYMAAQVEAESAWRKNAKLITPREYGCGYGQITRTARFDKLAELRQQYPRELGGWTWADCTDPVYQMRAVVLMNRDAAKRLPAMATAADKTAIVIAARNRGTGGVLSEIRACRMTVGCDPTRWHGHVAKTCTAGRAPLVGIGRSACDVNRTHVAKVLKRAPIYAAAMGDKA
jgi:hypothetical protein